MTETDSLMPAQEDSAPMSAAPAPVSVDIRIDGGGWADEAHLRALAERAAAALFALPYLRGCGTELSLVFTDDEAIRRLNAQWRQKDKPTNVLSFPAFPVTAGDKPMPMLGDVILAYETVTAEAAAESKPLDNHITHLLLHGMLHLLGYDHETDEEAEEMEGLERRLLAELGIADPYAGTE